MRSLLPSATRQRGQRSAAGGSRLLLLGVFVLALAARVVELVWGAQVRGGAAYDQSVHYAAADALLHGHWPYHGDVTFLHPPVVILVGLPFALVGSWTTALTGFWLANVVFAAVGAGTAVLVVAIALRWGCRRASAAAAGVFYATWVIVAASESSMRLEPLGDFTFALLILLLSGRTAPSRKTLVLAGVAAGVLVDIKIWWAAPILVVLVLTALRWRRLGVLVVSGGVLIVTAAVIALPFLAVSRGRMIRSIVLVQLGRDSQQWLPGATPGRLSTATRLSETTGVSQVLSAYTSPLRALDSTTAHVCALVVVLLLALTALRAVTTPLGRLVVPLLVVQAAVLMVAPIFFGYYGAFVGVALSLLIAATGGAAAGGGTTPRPAQLLAPAWAVLAVVTLVIALAPGPPPPLASVADRQALQRATRGAGCVVADSPRLLIETDALDRSFAPGCRDVVDFQGLMHGGGPDPEASAAGHTATPAYRRFVLRYLLSGDLLVIGESNAQILVGPSLARRLRGAAIKGRTGVVVVYGLSRSVR